MEQKNKFFKGIGYGLLYVLPSWVLADLAYFTVLAIFPDSTVIVRISVAVVVLAVSSEFIFSFLVNRQLKKDNIHVRDHRRL